MRRSIIVLFLIVTSLLVTHYNAQIVNANHHRGHYCAPFDRHCICFGKTNENFYGLGCPAPDEPGWGEQFLNWGRGIIDRGPKTPAEPAAPVCNPKGDIDPDTWQFIGEFCNKVKQGEVAEEWRCEKTTKYANSRSADICSIGSKQENDFTNTARDVCGDDTNCFDYVTRTPGRCFVDIKNCVLDLKKEYLASLAPPAKTIQEQLKEQYGAWVGAYCASVWSIHKGKDTIFDGASGSRCENAVKTIRFNGVTGCQNLPPEDDPEHPKLVSCIQTAADRIFKPTLVPRPPTSPTPRPIQTARPVGQAVPPGYNTDFDKHIYAWCGDGNGVTADKKDACVLKAFNECNKETDEQKFIECIQKVARDGFGGLALLPPKQKFTPPPADTTPAKKTPSASALINGSTGEVILPSDTESVVVGGKVKDGDTCIDTAISLTFFKIEENGQKLAPPKLISLKPHDVAFLSGLPRNCTTYTASLKDEKSGKYQLSVQLTDNLASKTAAYTSSEVATNTLIVTQAPAVSTTAKVFTCQTSTFRVEPTLIEVQVEKLEERPRAYDRINWYIGKLGEELKSKGTTYPGKTTFDAEPNSVYQIQAEYYSQDVSPAEKKGALRCFSTYAKTPASRQGRVKTTSKQLAAVLGTHTSPISFGILPIVTPESIVAVNVRAVTLDLEGKESGKLFPDSAEEVGQWENGRPLPLTINNPSQVSAVQVTVEGHNTYIPISKAAEEVIQLVKAAPQNIDLTMEADINQVVFTAYTVHPVDNPKFIVNDAEQYDPANSTCDESGKCVYSWTAYAPFSDSYNVSFGDKTVTFTPEEPAPASNGAGPAPPAGGPKQVIEITLSGEQVVYTFDQDTNQGYYAEADYDLSVGDNRFDYTVEYSDGTTETLHLVVKRQAITEGQPSAPTPEQPPAVEAPQISPPQIGGEPCENVGEYDRVCIDTEGTYKFRQCQDNNIWSDWLGSETNPDNACRQE